MPASSPTRVTARLSARLRSYLHAWLLRLAAVQVVDRAAGLAGVAFTALIPLFIVYDALVPAIDRRDFATGVINRFELRGAAAASVRQALLPPGEIKQGIGLVGVLLVVVGSLSFARALQRLYEQAFRLPPLGGVGGTPSTLVWLALIPVFATVSQLIGTAFDGPAAVFLSLAFGAALWTISPFVLLRRRLPWYRLLPAGIITAAAMSALSAATAVWMTKMVTDSVGRYGVIGVAFALLSWLVLAGFTLVGSATAGAVLTEPAGQGPPAPPPRAQRRRRPPRPG